MEAAVVSATALALYFANNQMEKRSPTAREEQLPVEPTIRDVKYVRPGNLLNIRKDMIVEVVQVPNLDRLGSPRYEVILIDGTRTQIHGHQAKDWLEPE